MRMSGLGLRRITSLLLLGALLYIGTFSFAFPLVHGDHGSGCEVSVAGMSLCTMSYSDMDLLIGSFSQAQPTLDSITLLLVVPVLVSGLLLLHPPRKRHRAFPSAQPVPVPLYTLLFSQGILNPKAP